MVMVTSEAAQIIAEVGERDPDARRLDELVEEANTEFLVKGLTRLRLWLGCPPDRGGRRPGREFFELLYGHGKDTAVGLVRAFEDQEATTPAELEAVARIARVARSSGRITWDLNDLAPIASDPAKVKVVAYAPCDLHGQARRIAFESGKSLSAFTTEALAAAVEQAQRRKPPTAPAP